ncbi:MAG: hypothetical protein HC802_08560 [Caldilineaceae bacterium]|nr:hypothetical protein [Caldilineaceae bacterium]
MSTQALLFLIGFLTILGLFIYFIRFMARRFNDRVSYRTYTLIERTAIGGIVVGAVGMFQPWFFHAYTLGFLVLLFSTLAFIVWSHVRPAPPPLEQVKG